MYVYSTQPAWQPVSSSVCLYALPLDSTEQPIACPPFIAGSGTTVNGMVYMP